jgi:tripartite-type tricarboxylate transporter receptor subunit TctC
VFSALCNRNGRRQPPILPYKGIQPALNDLAGGHIALMSAPIPVALPLVQGAGCACSA